MIRRLVGGILFFFGLAGLLLTLISWLPAGMNLAIVASVGLFCLGCVWGGGKLLQQLLISGRPTPNSFATQRSGQRGLVILCPRCGWQINPGQRFCGGCGLAVGSVCSRCGAVIAPGFKFCANCGEVVKN